MHHAQISNTPSSPPARRRTGQFGLAIGGPAIGTGEFASMSILPVVANDLHTTLPEMGHMISAYALGVVFGARSLPSSSRACRAAPC
jgi:DHA1 family inner membrane transport protein